VVYWCTATLPPTPSRAGPAFGRKRPCLTPRGDYMDPNSPPDGGGPSAETCASHGTRRPPTGQEGQRLLLPVRLPRRGAARTSSYRSLSAASFCDITFSQKDAIASHGLSLSSMASTMVDSESVPPVTTSAS
jgi:hypothetical protein